MSDLFGTPSGFRQFDRDRAELAQLGAQTQLTQAQTQHQLELSKLNQAQAAAIERKAKADEEELAMMRRALQGGPTGDDPIKTAKAVAGNLIQAGAVTKGLAILDDAAGALQKLSGAEANAALKERRLTQTELEKIGFIQQVMSSVRDPQSHGRALMLLQGNPLTADMPLTEQLQTYNPGAIAALIAGTKAKDTELRLRLAASETASRNASRSAANRVRDILADQSERRTKAYVERAARVEKVGGERAITPPTRDERADVLRELKSLGYADIEDGAAAALEIASDAKLLHSRNPSISLSQARAQAIESAIKRGDLKQTPGLLRDSAKFELRGGSLSRPLPLPKSRTDLREGAYYSADGEVRQYRNGKWVAAMQAQPAAADLTDEDEE